VCRLYFRYTHVTEYRRAQQITEIRSSWHLEFSVRRLVFNGVFMVCDYIRIWRILKFETCNPILSKVHSVISVNDETWRLSVQSTSLINRINIDGVTWNSLLPQRPGFNPTAVYVVFVIREMLHGQIYFREIQGCTVNNYSTNSDQKLDIYQTYFYLQTQAFSTLLPSVLWVMINNN
jgi:hypothetical protein